MFSNSRREKCWCRHQRWIWWFQHARISAHKYFDDGADCSELCGRVCAWRQHSKIHTILVIFVSEIYVFHPVLYSSCHLYKFDVNVHFLEKVELLLRESYCCVSTLKFRWILLALNIEMRESSDSAKNACLWKMCTSEIKVDHRRMCFHRRLYRLAASRLRQSHLTSNAGNVMDIQTKI